MLPLFQPAFSEMTMAILDCGTCCKFTVRENRSPSGLAQTLITYFRNVSSERDFTQIKINFTPKYEFILAVTGGLM